MVRYCYQWDWDIRSDELKECDEKELKETDQEPCKEKHLIGEWEE